MEGAIFACLKKRYREASIKNVVIGRGVFHNRAWRLGHALVRGVCPTAPSSWLVMVEPCPCVWVLGSLVCKRKEPECK